ncbi:MAG: AEC family transporter, partial [Proteobacteria bacterium]|nr:AEC family transporter [Pseudomonadota bacterium]
MIARLLGIVLPVFSIVALGWFFGRRAKPDMTWVNKISMNMLAPALVFSALAGGHFDLRANAVLMLASLGVVLGSGLLAWPVARWLRVDYRTFLPPMMFNNCGNIGLPLAALAFGNAGFAPMVALFTISNLLQFSVGMWIVDHHAKLWNLVRNPIVIATIAGFACALTSPPIPSWLQTAIHMLGEALIPMMLLSLGVRLTTLSWHGARIGVIGGAVCALTGLAMAALLIPLLRLDPLQSGLLYLFGCLPPAVL